MLAISGPRVRGGWGRIDVMGRERMWIFEMVKLGGGDLDNRARSV